MNRYNLINYDVWGNKKDGFEVNDLFKVGEVELKEDCTDRDILNTLKDYGYLKQTVRINQVDFEDLGIEMIEISERRTTRPIGSLRLIMG